MDGDGLGWLIIFILLLTINGAAFVKMSHSAAAPVKEELSRCIHRFDYCRKRDSVLFNWTRYENSTFSKKQRNNSYKNSLESTFSHFYIVQYTLFLDDPTTCPYSPNYKHLTLSYT
ncbi:hypothetical protein AC623_11090 [Bacillus sp. FJAT-27231]|uniref:hypothetical protein n=1 Tax=Bacillus sp. FJAT-27231 TaxID=1679168 RepID=UPI0006709460|nr:hypothetical protein [Bacillus sp. FJAT-27231]KMY54409.1 hypothetical protein AC623_11090 [Bacillus sp. FJAT-27231]